MNHLVYYSLTILPGEPRPDLLRQLVTSVQTLRQHNSTVRIVVFVHGDTPPALEPALAPYDVHMRSQGRYAERLARLCPRGWLVLEHYPLLHKFLNFAELTAMQPSQVLFLDCDTIFFDDVELLFARYVDAHCYAREEPSCRRSHYGYDPGYVDEALLARIARLEGVRSSPPFNLGVVLFNHGIWATLANLERTLVSYAWRLIVWLAVNPDEMRTNLYGEGDAVRLLRQHWDSLAAADEQASALAYPSANEWIVDQVALWLTLGHIPGLAYGDFSPLQVLQNGEFLEYRGRRSDWILCHYFTQNMSRLENWLRAPEAATRY